MAEPDPHSAQKILSLQGAEYAQKCMAQSAGVLRTFSGVEAAYGSHPCQTLTIFFPKKSAQAVLLFFHGGGWVSGCKEWMYFMAPALLLRNVALICANYRLAPEHLYPACAEDAAEAVAWVYRHIHQFCTLCEYRLCGRIFVGGHSAGGHLAALLAVTNTWLSQRQLPDGLIRGCLPISGVYCFGPDSGLRTRPRFLGEVAENEALASPIYRLGSSVRTPFFMSHGDRDFNHLIAQAVEMKRLLHQYNVPVVRQVLADCDHFGSSLACGDPADHAWAAKAAKWMGEVINTGELQ